MTVSLMKRSRRPSWMTPYGHEGWGDVFFDRLLHEWPRYTGEEWTPSVDLVEKDGEYKLTAEIPGMEKDDISVSYDDGYLTISGKKESKREEEGSDYHMKEMRYGSFSRSFHLPKKVNTDKLDATYKDGLLTVFLPHEEDSKTRKIEVH